MQELEEEGAQLRTKRWKASQLPAARPVYSWVTELNSQRCERTKAISFCAFRPEQIIHQEVVDGFNIAEPEVDRGGFEASQCWKEVSSEVGWYLWLWKLLVQYIEPEQPLMVEVAGEPGADGSLQEGGDQKSQCAALDT